MIKVACWTMAGERQVQKMRIKYVRSILSQEVGWFDTCGASELSTRASDLIGRVQDGITRRAGDLIQFIAQFIFAFIAAFYLSWRLTIVLLASFPMIGGTHFHSTHLNSLQFFAFIPPLRLPFIKLVISTFKRQH